MPWMACGDRPVESAPSLGDFPAAGLNPAAGLLRGQIGVWTGLIIPAPIWREGMDSPSGMRSHGGRSRGLAPLPPPPSGRLATHPSLTRAGRPKRYPSRQSAAHLAEAQPQVANPCLTPAGSRATLDSYNNPPEQPILFPFIHL